MLFQVCKNNLQPVCRQFLIYTRMKCKYPFFLSRTICLYKMQSWQSFCFRIYYFIHSNYLWKDCRPTPNGEPSVASHALYRLQESSHIRQLVFFRESKCDGLLVTQTIVVVFHSTIDMIAGRCYCRCSCGMADGYRQLNQDRQL